MHCLTVDLEDWFHFLDIDENIDVAGWDSYETYVVSMTTELLSFFDAYDQKATFFVLGWVADRFPELIRDVLWHGHEIACHSYGHPLVYGLSPTDFERDLVKALDKIEAACGLRPTAYRAPGFSITADCLWAFDILRKNGIVTDSSIFPANRAHGGFDGAPVRPFIIETAYGDIVELPISCVNFMGIKYIYSGGGYFRITPGWLLHKFFRNADAIDGGVITYFHPRDFFRNIPIPKLSPIREFKARIGLGKNFLKLGNLLSLRNFCTVSEFINLHKVDHWGRFSLNQLL